MRGIRISSRYAKSLLSLCIERGKVDEAFSDMTAVFNAIDGSRDLSNFLKSPLIKPDKKINILTAIFGNQIGQLTMSFVSLLTKKGREALLAEIAESFISQVKEYKNISSVILTTAVKLDESTRAKIVALAGKLKNGTVELKEEIDQTIIGGFVLQAGDKKIDASVVSELKELRREFEKNPYVAEL
ncbi:MAG: ATP synthase F1 subunit delta [Crocinitomicaceae bacterium]|nr:ATP synthase F1 subunit delta [Crocinitomicaceae bacterium]